MLTRSSLLLLAIVHSGQSIFFDLFGGGCNACGGGGYGSNYGGSYGGLVFKYVALLNSRKLIVIFTFSVDYGAANYGYGGQSYGYSGQNYGTQTFVQQPQCKTLCFNWLEL